MMPKVEINQHVTQPEIKSNGNTGISKYLSIITLKVKRLNLPVKRQIICLDPKARPNNLLLTGNTSHPKTHIK
jgi:hypothetical protein